jgi:hypothetical protein
VITDRNTHVRIDMKTDRTATTCHELDTLDLEQVAGGRGEARRVRPPGSAPDINAMHAQLCGIEKRLSQHSAQYADALGDALGSRDWSADQRNALEHLMGDHRGMSAGVLTKHCTTP